MTYWMLLSNKHLLRLAMGKKQSAHSMTALSSMACLVVLMAQAISTPIRDTWKVSVSQNKNAILIDTGVCLQLTAKISRSIVRKLANR